MKRTFYFFFMLLLIIASLSAESFYIKNYDVRINVLENGEKEIEERLDLYFTRPSHGFIRDIQTSFSSPLNFWDEIKGSVSEISATDLVSTERDGKFTSLKLGDSSKTITGDKTYFIKYKLNLGYDRYSDYDEFYYNIVSSSWDCPIYNVTYTVTFPHRIDKTKIWVTTGRYGSNNSSPFTLLDDGLTIVGREKNLLPYDALTVRVELPEGYFNFQKNKITSFFNAISPYISLALYIFISIFAISTWKKYGKDEDLIVTPEFKSPEGVNPMDAGFILNNEVKIDKVLSAMLFYWADSGYITLEGINKEKTTIIHKIKDLPYSTKESEKCLFNALFMLSENPTLEEISKTNFALIAETKVVALEKTYFTKDRSFSDKESEKKKSQTLVLGFITILLSSFFSSFRFLGLLTIVLLFSQIIPYSLSLVIMTLIEKKEQSLNKIIKGLFYIALALCSFMFLLINFAILYTVFPLYLNFIWSLIVSISILIISIFGVLTNKRSPYYQKALENVLGYREFIKVAEIDELKLLIEDDPDFYYHTLSYAIVFNLENEWAKKFKSLSLINPSWYYSATDDALSALFYLSLSRRWRSAYITNVRPTSFPISGGGGKGSFRGSSGFSGGGFSGGGGRSW